jgi:hypothetical protein
MQETVEITWKNAASQLRDRAVKHGEIVEKCSITGASQRNEREDGHGRMKEDEGRKQKKKMIMMIKTMVVMMMMMMRLMMMTVTAKTMMM